MLRRKLATTNPIELCCLTVERVARGVNVGAKKSAAALDRPGPLEENKKFRRIKGDQEICR